MEKIWVRLRDNYVVDALLNNPHTTDYELIEVEKVPLDISSGYYTYINGELILDETSRAMRLLEGQVRSEIGYNIESTHDYSYMVSLRIRGRYTISDEISILRQKDEKPEEYQAWYDFTEACKAEVKQLLSGTNGTEE